MGRFFLRYTSLRVDCPRLGSVRALAALGASEAILLLIYMATAAMVLDAFMQTRSLEEGSPQFGFRKMLDGSAERPYVYRRLIPLVVNRLVELVPEDQQNAFVEYHLDRFHLKQRYFGHARFPNRGVDEWTPAYSLSFHATYLIMFGSLLALMYFARSLTNITMPQAKATAAIAPIFLVEFLPLTFLHGNFFYDFPELLLLSILLWSAYRARYWLWLLLLPTAVLNKESNILVPLLYLPVIYGNARNAHSAVAVGLSVILAFTVFLLVRSAYADNSGGEALWQLPQNLEFWLTPRNYLLWSDFYATLIPFPRGANVLLLCVIAYLVLAFWSSKPPREKLLFLVAIAINVPLLLCFGYQDEIRNLSFVFLPTYLLGTFSMSRLLSSR